MSPSDPDLCRVSVHAGTDVIDLALPAMVPVATLIPSIVDLLGESAGDPVMRYQLSRPGLPVLLASTTLAQNGIRDGAVLVLSRSSAEPPAPRHHDAAEAVAAALESPARSGAAHPARLTGALAAGCLAGVGVVALARNAVGASIATVAIAATAAVAAVVIATVAHRVHRDPVAGRTLSVIAAAFAAVAGLMAVPGAPAAATVLLAAMTAAVTSVVAIHVTGCGGVTLTAVACFAIVIALAALAGLLTDAPPYTIGSLTALVSLALLGTAPRVSIVLAGLSPRVALEAAESLADKTIRADSWLASLHAAFSSSAAAGAIATALAHNKPAGIGFAAVTAAVLLLGARRYEGRKGLLSSVIGTSTTAMTFAIASVGMPRPWVAAVTALLVAVAMYLGFVAPGLSPSPVLRRGSDLFECLALVAMVPLACWICGLYSTVRGLDLL